MKQNTKWCTEGRKRLKIILGKSAYFQFQYIPTPLLMFFNFILVVTYLKCSHLNGVVRVTACLSTPPYRFINKPLFTCATGVGTTPDSP